MAFVCHGDQEAKSQAIEEGPARGCVQMSPKSPEPEKVHEAVRQDVAGFPEVKIEGINLIRFQGHKPGKEPS